MKCTAGRYLILLESLHVMKHTASVLWEKKPGEIFVDNKRA